MEVDFSNSEFKDYTRSLFNKYMEGFLYGEYDYATKTITKRKGKPSFMDFLEWLGVDS